MNKTYTIQPQRNANMKSHGKKALKRKQWKGLSIYIEREENLHPREHKVDQTECELEMK